MKLVYCISLLTGFSVALQAMENNGKGNGHNEIEMKEVVVNIPQSAIAVDTLMERLNMSAASKQTKSYGIIKNILELMSKRDPKYYMNLSKEAEVTNWKPEQFILTSVLEYDHIKNENTLMRLITELKSWRTFAYAGWSVAVVTAFALATGALTVATAQ